VFAGVGLYMFTVMFLKAGPVLDRSRLNLKQSVRILDRDGGMLYQFSSGEQRLFLQSDDIPDVAKKAIVAIEDERFLHRYACVDVRAIFRAFRSTVFDHRLQGASTITQQLTRMLYLTPEKTLTRKLYEIMLSCRLEHLLTKQEILTLYLNGVSYGNGINGLEQASQSYFGIPASKLSIAQAAVLASIPQRPTYYSPYGPHLYSDADGETIRSIRKGTLGANVINPASMIPGLLPRMIQGKGGAVRVRGRSDDVLRSMRRLGFIDQNQFAAASQELLHLKLVPPVHRITAPHFALWMRSEIESLLQGVDAPAQWESEGLTVRTTLDPVMQGLAENVILQSQPLLEKVNAKNIALVALDRQTRRVVAYVGNNDFFANAEDGQVDMARAARQPGSSFKPLVYASAFEHGFTPETIVHDSPIRIGNDEPKNYEGGFLGAITIRTALARSRNIPAIRTFVDIGGEDIVLALAARAGLTTPLAYKEQMLQVNPGFTYGWPMAIGSVEVPLIEMVQLYATIANHGIFTPLRTFCSVTNRLGTDLFAGQPKEFDQAIEAQAADAVDDILRDSESRPAGFWRSALTIDGLNVAAKTGTSNVCFRRDVFGRCTEYGVNNVWTMGYTDQLVVGVWVGNADNSVMDPLADGLTVAAPIWRAFLEQASPYYDPEKVRCE
jgi:membrane peptidoglycan carboxypeptidase